MNGAEEVELPPDILDMYAVTTPSGWCRCLKYDHLHPEHDDKEASTI